MPLFFLPETPTGTTAILDREQSHHLSRVLRHQVGDRLKLADAQGHCYEGRIGEIRKNAIVMEAIEKTASPPPPFSIQLNVSVLQTEKMELVIQKAVELNIMSVQWMICERTQKSSLVPKKWQRLEKVAVEAQKQCERPLPMTMPLPQKFSELIDGPNNILCVERNKRTASRLLGGRGSKRQTIWVGPEGGWSENELNQASAAGFSFCSLGPLVLRAETAAIAAMANLSLLKFEEIEDSHFRLDR